MWYSAQYFNFFPLVANLQNLGDFTVSMFLALLNMSEDPARWACWLPWLHLEPRSCSFLKVGIHPPLAMSLVLPLGWPVCDPPIS